MCISFTIMYFFFYVRNPKFQQEQGSDLYTIYFNYSHSSVFLFLDCKQSEEAIDFTMKFIHLFFSMYKCSTKEQCSDDLVMRQSVYSYILLVSLLIERFFFSIFSADSPLVYLHTDGKTLNIKIVRSI